MSLVGKGETTGPDASSPRKGRYNRNSANTRPVTRTQDVTLLSRRPCGRQRPRALWMHQNMKRAQVAKEQQHATFTNAGATNARGSPSTRRLYGPALRANASPRPSNSVLLLDLTLTTGTKQQSTLPDMLMDMLSSKVRTQMRASTAVPHAHTN